MPTTTLVAFDRPLAGAYVPGRDGTWMTEGALAAIRLEAYQKGSDAARAFADQQLVEFRRDVQDLQQGLLTQLAEVDQRITNQLQATLPALAVEIARRLLAGYEPTPERVVAVCTEALDQLYPDVEALELLVSPADAERLEQVDNIWRSRYPGLRVTTVPSLHAGDCQVRSRFGLTDARLESKLNSLRRELTPESAEQQP
jgi:flagellar assembly protein FliH